MALRCFLKEFIRSFWIAGSLPALCNFSRETVCSMTQGLWVKSQSSGSSAPPQLIGGMIPGPPQIQGQLRQRLRSTGFGRTKRVIGIAHS